MNPPRCKIVRPRSFGDEPDSIAKANPIGIADLGRGITPR